MGIRTRKEYQADPTEGAAEKTLRTIVTSSSITNTVSIEQEGFGGGIDCVEFDKSTFEEVVEDLIRSGAIKVNL